MRCDWFRSHVQSFSVSRSLPGRLAGTSRAQSDGCDTTKLDVKSAVKSSIRDAQVVVGRHCIEALYIMCTGEKSFESTYMTGCKIQLAHLMPFRDICTRTQQLEPIRCGSVSGEMWFIGCSKFHTYKSNDSCV